MNYYDAYLETFSKYEHFYILISEIELFNYRGEIIWVKINFMED